MGKRVEYSGVEVRRHFSEATSRAHWGKEHIKVFCRSKFVLAIVSPEDAESLGSRVAGKKVSSIREARRRFSELIAAVREGEQVCIHKLDKLYVVLIPPIDFERLQSGLVGDDKITIREQMFFLH